MAAHWTKSSPFHAPNEPDPASVVDEAAEDDAADDTLDVIPMYRILSYGADLDVLGLVRRLEGGDIEIPEFQRGFVWTHRQASRFIESLLIGLPVPGVFFWKDPANQKLVVVDGQQRLRTLQAYYGGILRDRKFKLADKTSSYQRVHPAFQGKDYRSLGDDHRRTLDNTIIHATIVQQDDPEDDDSSIYYLFERLNTEGTPLDPQEIRSAVYRGSLNAVLTELNDVPTWRGLYGPVSSRMKDRELILRFFALSEATFADAPAKELDPRLYASPMKEFLNRYSRRNRHVSQPDADKMKVRFESAVKTIQLAVGRRAFRPDRAFNAAVFDSVMVGIDRRLCRGREVDPSAVSHAYDGLLASGEYQKAYRRATANDQQVKERLRLATDAFADLP